MDDADNNLSRVLDLAFQRLEGLEGDLSALEEPDRTLVLVCSAQGVIDNGGLPYFFSQDWPENTPYAAFADAYRRIGCNRAASTILAAAKSFGLSHPERDREGRLEFMKRRFGDELIPKAEDDLWNDDLCGDPNIWSSLAQWARDYSASG